MLKKLVIKDIFVTVYVSQFYEFVFALGPNIIFSHPWIVLVESTVALHVLIIIQTGHVIIMNEMKCRSLYCQELKFFLFFKKIRKLQITSFELKRNFVNQKRLQVSHIWRERMEQLGQ